jgi:hypothetical protein
MDCRHGSPPGCGDRAFLGDGTHEENAQAAAKAIDDHDFRVDKIETDLLS